MLACFGGEAMIANFRHCETMDFHAIFVDMRWSADGAERMAQMVVPWALQFELAAKNYPATNPEELTVEAALSYAVFLGMRTGVPVRLTGDITVWDDRWGVLEYVQRSPSRLSERLNATN
jgi:hypothetical protein